MCVALVIAITQNSTRTETRSSCYNRPAEVLIRSKYEQSRGALSRFFLFRRSRLTDERERQGSRVGVQHIRGLQRDVGDLQVSTFNNSY